MSNEVNDLKFDMVGKDLERHEQRIGALEVNLSEMTKLSTLMEVQIEMNKKQDEVLGMQSITLGKINDNLTSLNNVTVNLEKRIGDLETEFKQDKEKNNIDIRSIIQKVIIGLVIGVVGFVLAKNGIPFTP